MLVNFFDRVMDVILPRFAQYTLLVILRVFVSLINHSHFEYKTPGDKNIVKLYLGRDTIQGHNSAAIACSYLCRFLDTRLNNRIT